MATNETQHCSMCHPGSSVRRSVRLMRIVCPAPQHFLAVATAGSREWLAPLLYGASDGEAATLGLITETASIQTSKMMLQMTRQVSVGTPCRPWIHSIYSLCSPCMTLPWRLGTTGVIVGCRDRSSQLTLMMSIPAADEPSSHLRRKIPRTSLAEL